jgi:hypothetical protein
MSRRTFAAFFALLAIASPALAASETWLVTEENVAGVKGAQGTWSVTVDAGKVTGTADMMSGRGAPLAYKIDGAVAEGVYTLNLNDRTDGKKSCVWTGHTPSSASSQKAGLIGYAECEGAKLILRASPAPQ